MSHVIAVAGKGGVGKTTLCGLLIQYLCEQKKGPILAVDADANSNLNEVLGVEVEATLGDIREEIARAETAKENPIPAGVSKADYAEFKFNSALIEDDDFDMLVMGRTQGKGCYCYYRHSLLNCRTIIRIWLWIMKQEWNTSAVEFFRACRLLFWSATVPEEESRRSDELKN